MTKTTSPLHLTLEDTLAPAGFWRKGDSWFRSTDDVVEVVNLQKSQYGPQYYLNFAVWLRALGGEAFPKEHKCHIRMRVHAIADEEYRVQMDRLLDLDSGVPADERRAQLGALLRERFLAFSEAAGTVNGLRSLLEDGRLEGAMVHWQAKEILNRTGA